MHDIWERRCCFASCICFAEDILSEDTASMDALLCWCGAKLVPEFVLQIQIGIDTALRRDTRPVSSKGALHALRDKLSGYLRAHDGGYVNLPGSIF